jgi:hypothetical protein
MSEKEGQQVKDIKARRAQSILAALVKMSENDMPIRMAVRIGRNITAMREYVEPLEDALKKIFEELKNKEGTITPGTKKHEEFIARTDVLYDETYAVGFYPVATSELEEIELQVSPVVAAELFECGILVADE